MPPYEHSKECALLLTPQQPLIDQLGEDVKTVRPAVEKTRQNQTKNPDVDRLEEDVNRLRKRWESCCMQVSSPTKNFPKEIG